MTEDEKNLVLLSLSILTAVGAVAGALLALKEHWLS